ncbi:MAG: DsbA family protein [Actinomycetota bacterium]|nr:DsbA family protein [Actinomycetota bacterium]
MDSTTAQFFFDPACPWTWMTSRWLTDVAQARGVEVRWRPFSLKFNGEGQDVPEPYVSYAAASHRALRVMEAIRDGEGDEPLGPYYTELGRRIHHDGDMLLDDLAGAVAACGLDPKYVHAADDDRWDQPIRASMAEALDAAGPDVGSPILMLSVDPPRAFFGPIVSPPPTGTAALDLWDRVSGMAEQPSFFELKRSRSGGPQLGPRP